MYYQHDLSPILVQIGPLAIRWYSLAYIFGMVGAVYYIFLLNKKFQFITILNKKIAEDLLFRGIIGILIGGRLGYVIFYNFSYYLSNFHEIFYIWEGGMSFHGGITGCTFAVLYHAKKSKVKFLSYMDLVACSSPIGLFLGRITNFINGELYGSPTTLPWGVIFPASGDGIARHPTQLYEAFTEGFLSFFIMLIAIHLNYFKNNRGKLCGLFLLCYSISRLFIEFVRLPDNHIGYFYEIFTLGQILTLPMLFLSLYMLFIYKDK